MKKFTKALLVALIGMSAVGCETFPANSSSGNSSTVQTDPLLAAIDARIVLVKDKQEVSDDFEVPNLIKLTYEGKEISVNITWTADKENVTFENVEVEENGVTVTKTMAKLKRPAKGENPVTVNLTASYEHEGKKGSKAFRVTVMPKQGLDDLWGVEPTQEVMSWDDFRAAEINSKITVQGVVSAWTYDESYGNGNVFLQDEDGGYYAYRLVASLSDYEDYLKVGNEVILEGQKSVYEGLHQLNQKTVTSIKVLDRAEDGTEDDQNRPTPKDVTQLAKEAKLEPLQSTWATVLGTYVNKSGDHYVQVGAEEYQLYIDSKYISPKNLAEVETAVEGLTAGDTIRLTGIVGMYQKPQFYPYELAKSDEEIIITNDDKAAIALNNASEGFEEVYTEDTEVDLFTSEEADVTVSYALNAEADTTVFALNNETKKLTVTPTEEEKTATLTITVTCGDVTKSAEVTLNACKKIEIVSLTRAIELAQEAGDDYSTEKYYVKGTIKEVKNTTYGNMTITDGTTDFEIYGTYSKDGSQRYDVMENKPDAGDEVILYGVLGTYTKKNDDGSVAYVTPQMKNGWFHTHIDILSLARATELAQEAGDSYSTEKYYVKGTIKEVKNTQYGNMTITDGTTDFEIYGSYSADGTKRYDAMENKPVAGDEVVLYGILGTYTKKNDDGSVAYVTPQMKNGWFYSHTPATSVEPEQPEQPTGTMTIAQVLAAADGTQVVVTGIVKNAVWNDQYNDNNVTIIDENLDEIYCYGLKTKVAVGDNITVTGTKTSYNGAPQIGQGATAVINSSGNEIPAPVVGDNEVLVDFSTLGYTNAQEFTSYTSGIVTFSGDKGTNSNSPKYYDTGTAVRFYGSNSLTIDLEEGYAITSIEITFGSGDKDNAITSDVGTFAGTTWTGESNTVVLTVGGTSGHRRIQAIKVSYKAA